MKTVKTLPMTYLFAHYRMAVVVDTAHIGGAAGRHEVIGVCETRFPYSSCPCGEYQVQWGSK